MSDPSEPVFTHRGILDLIQDPNVSHSDIIHHVQNLQADVQRVYEENINLRTQLNAQPAASSTREPLLSLSASVEAVANAQAESLRIYQETRASQMTHQANMDRILDLLTQRQTVTQGGRLAIPLPLSPKFKGPEGEVSFTEFKAKLRTQQSRFYPALDSDVDKITYAFQCMEGPPARYISVFVNQQQEDTEGLLTNYDTFLRVIDRVFGDQQNTEEAEHSLNRLRQGQSTLPDYIVKFRELSAKTTWNESALLSTFKEGLSYNIKNVLATQWHRLTTIEDTISAASQAAQNLRLQDRFRPRHSHQTTHQTPRRFPASAAASGPSSGAGPMDLDAVSFKRIAPEERQRRMDLRLCLYCGGSGHQVRSCPVKKPIHANVMTAEDDDEENGEAGI
jgi:hypothetical protein